MPRTYILLIAITISLSSAVRAADGPRSSDRFWPRWRGPEMTGVAPHGDPPTVWSETENIAWKVEIPGRGLSSPIVWGDRIYLQTAVPIGEELEPAEALEDWQADGREVYKGQAYRPSQKRQRFVVLAIDRSTGKTVWQRIVHEEQPREGVHPTNSWASASLATDGRHLVSFFGSRGLYVLDMNGQLLWQKDLGEMETRRGWGEGASPALYGERIVVNWDHEGPSFIAAFDLESGHELWRRDRDEVSTWFTPLIVEADDATQVVTAGARHVQAYDLESGDTLWSGPGLTLNAIPTPVAAGGRVYLTSGFRGQALIAVDLARAKGDLEEAGAIVWRHDRDTPYVPSPLLYGETLYFTKGLGNILTSLDVTDGRVIYGPVRLDALKGLYASPVAAAGRIYFVGREGTTVVLAHGPEPTVLAVNKLDDGFDASPAIVDRELYLRGRSYLYKIAAEAP